MKINKLNDELITIKQAATLLNVAEITIKRYVAKNLVSSVKIGGARRIVRNETLKKIMNTNQNDKKINTTYNGAQFYWSQKKAEIAQQIYIENCKKGDIIMDPFLGAGSSLYGIRGLQNKFIGIEINEHPFMITKFNIKKNDEKVINDITEKLLFLKNKYKNYYLYKTKKGDKLEFTKAIFDRKNKVDISTIFFNDESGNIVTTKEFPELKSEFMKRYKKYQKLNKNIKNKKLDKNSRIAIKENMMVSDIFSPINFHLLSMIKKEIEKDDNLKFILGAVLHLCKLTDKKSQSQFPYWIPKKDVVDRNVFLTMLRKIESLNKYKRLDEIQEANSFKKLDKASNGSCLLFNKATQNITNKDIPNNSIDFILTDPPYFDQIAYSEYLKIWEFFLGYSANFKDEIIISQRKINVSSEKEYLSNLKKAFKISFEKIKYNSEMWVYFKESRPDKIGLFLEILNEIGFSYVDQEFIYNDKYTYKQNTSSKTTVNGDIIFKFTKIKNNKNDNITPNSSSNIIDVELLVKYFVKTYLFKNKSATFSELLNNGLLKELYENNYLSLLKDSKSVIAIIEKIANYDNENRLFSLKKSKDKNLLLYGDCLNLLKSLPDNSFDCCITDPPYNISGNESKSKIGWLKSNKTWEKTKSFNIINEKWDKFSNKDYEEFTYKWITEVKRIVKPNGNIAIFGSYHNIYNIGHILEKLDTKIINSIVWFKRNAFPNITQRMFCESTEHIIWATNNNKKNATRWTFNYQRMKEINGGKQMRNMFDIPNTKTSERKQGKHPSQKPIQVLDLLIEALSNEEDVIIDPFIGSGTTAVSAIKNNRKFVGIDNSIEYLHISEKRINEILRDD